MGANFKFVERIKPQGYFDKQDDSFLDVYGLVRGSFNTLINDEGKISTRKGLTLVGNASVTGKPIVSAYRWETSTAKTINLQSQYNKLQVLYNDVWKDIRTGDRTDVQFVYDKWWDRTEIKDRLLMVNGTTSIFHWTGGFTELMSWTAATLTKKFALQSSGANPFTFDDTTKTLVQTGVSFITLGFEVGQVVRITGTSNGNNGLFTIKTVAADTLTFITSDTITDEVIATTACIIGVLGRETWAAERFTASGTKQITVGGTTFTYTGGENTPTLTGLSADPTAFSSVGLFVYQNVQSATPTGGDFPAGQKLDILGVNLNQAIIGYTQGRTGFLTKQTSFTDCGYTSPVRKAGEGGTFYLDNNLVGIAPSKSETFVSAGTSDVYRLYFEVFSDGTAQGEQFLVKKLETAYGQGAVSQSSFVKVKNGIAYVSNEPTIDFLGNVENIATSQTLPLSDPIKRLLSGLTLTGVQGVYHKNYVFYLFPANSVLLMYDMQRSMWQPPQVISGSCLSVIEDNVCVHSNTKDEVYSIFTGLTDNGAPISFNATTNVEMYGTRTKRKVYDELFVEALVNPSATAVLATLLSGYKGATGTHSFNFGFNDATNFIEVPSLPSGLGTAPFGYNPFGGLFTDPSLDPEIGDLRKIYKVSGHDKVESFSHQLAFTGDESGSYWEIFCYGVNAREADTSNVDIKE